MSTGNILKFNETVLASPELQAKVQTIHLEGARATAEKIAALGAEAGQPFTAEEFLTSAAASVSELSDADLEAVAGGGREHPGMVAMSIITLGIGCAIGAVVSAAKDGEAKSCFERKYV